MTTEKNPILITGIDQEGQCSILLTKTWLIEKGLKIRKIVNLKKIMKP